jgi:hypothetical protein
MRRNRAEVAYREAVALKRQEELIREEEAAGQAETEMRIKREAAEKEKRSKKKQVCSLCFSLGLLTRNMLFSHHGRLYKSRSYFL